MATYRINSYIPAAINYIKDEGLLEEGKVDKAFRGRISQFGAAVQLGSLKAAVAFYSEQGGSATDRSILMKIIYRLVYLTPEDKTNVEAKDLLLKVVNEGDLHKEEILDAATAIKLALNAYEWNTGKADEGKKTDKAEKTDEAEKTDSDSNV